MNLIVSFYTALVKHESVSIFQLVPILYFTWVFGRLIYYKFKYTKILLRDVLTLFTLVALALDYVYYLYAFARGSGQLLSVPGFLIKYSLGAILWTWMFIYHYSVITKDSPLDRKKAIFVYALAMLLILFLISILQR
jgi:hypothetical protein